MEELSHGQYSCPIIVRAIVGSKTPINPGPQHDQDFTDAFRKMFRMPIHDPQTPREVLAVYENAFRSNSPCIVIERRDLYGIED